MRIFSRPPQFSRALTMVTQFAPGRYLHRNGIFVAIRSARAGPAYTHIQAHTRWCSSLAKGLELKTKEWLTGHCRAIYGRHFHELTVLAGAAVFATTSWRGVAGSAMRFIHIQIQYQREWRHRALIARSKAGAASNTPLLALA